MGDSPYTHRTLGILIVFYLFNSIAMLHFSIFYGYFQADFSPQDAICIILFSMLENYLAGLVLLFFPLFVVKRLSLLAGGVHRYLEIAENRLTGLGDVSDGLL